MHENIYCGVYIMNEEELLVQICGLHKESKGIMGKRAPWNSFFYGFVGKALGCITCMFPKKCFFFFLLDSSPGEINIWIKHTSIKTNKKAET